jgi:type II secretory pathway pseudopilin PulG
MKSNNIHNTAGFTYIELMIAMFIMILISAAISMFVKNILTMNRYYTESVTAQEGARRAIKVMDKEVRALSPSSTGSYPISQADSFTFVFYSDIDNDLFKERIRYFIDGSILKKGVIKPTGSPLSYNPDDETVMDLTRGFANGAEPLFSYYDMYYDGTTDPLESPVDVSSIRLLKIVLLIDMDPVRPPGPITITTQITMRNLKDSL